LPVATFVLCAVAVVLAESATRWRSARTRVARNRPLPGLFAYGCQRGATPCKRLAAGARRGTALGGSDHRRQRWRPALHGSGVQGPRGGCVVLELESKANDQLRVIEMSFPPATRWVGHRVAFCDATIHGTPNLSATRPRRDAKGVGAMGTCTDSPSGPGRRIAARPRHHQRPVSDSEKPPEVGLACALAV